MGKIISCLQPKSLMPDSPIISLILTLDEDSVNSLLMVKETILIYEQNIEKRKIFAKKEKEEEENKDIVADC